MKNLLAVSAVLVAVAVSLLVLAISIRVRRPDQAKHAPAMQPKWTFKTGGGIFSSVALDEEGNAYMGSEDGYLYAVRPDGRKKWEYETGAIESSPVVAGDTVYVSTIDGDVFAFNKDGSQRWQADVGSHRDRGAPAVSQYNVYVECRRGAICALDPVDGSERWHSEGFHLSERTAAAVTNDNKVLLGALRGRLYQLRGSDGEVQWRYPAIHPGEDEAQFSPNAFNAPAIASDGSIYAGSTDKSLYKFTSGGEKLWSFPTGGILNGSPVIGVDETVYIGSEDRYLYAITPAGTQKWKFQADSQIDSAPAIAADGTIYATSNAGTVYALNGEGILQWTCATGGGRLTSPAIARDGTIYVTSWSGRLYGISAPGRGLAASAWPKFHHDAGNSGLQP